MRDNICFLNEMEKGDRGVISAILPGCTIRGRLLELGFNIGESVECVLVSPLGDPKAYRICGAVVALRDTDASFLCCADIYASAQH